MDTNHAERERRYDVWQDAEHALDAHEDTAWRSTLRPDGTYMIHDGQGIDAAWLRRDDELRAARDAAREAFMEHAHRPKTAPSQTCACMPALLLAGVPELTGTAHQPQCKLGCCHGAGVPW